VPVSAYLHLGEVAQAVMALHISGLTGKYSILTLCLVRLLGQPAFHELARCPLMRNMRLLAAPIPSVARNSWGARLSECLKFRRVRNACGPLRIAARSIHPQRPARYRLIRFSGRPRRASATQVRALPSFGDENAPARPGNDQSFIHEDLDSAAGCGPRDPVGLGQPVQAWHLLARQKLAIGDLLAQFRRDAQIGRYQLSDHKINVPSRPLTCVCTRLCCAVLD